MQIFNSSSVIIIVFDKHLNLIKGHNLQYYVPPKTERVSLSQLRLNVRSKCSKIQTNEARLILPLIGLIFISIDGSLR